MIRQVIVDTGPLVAYLNGRDTWHGWAVERFREIEPPVWSCEAVLSEASFLLRDDARGPDALLGMLEDGLIEIDFDLIEHAPVVRALMKKYASVPMSLADGCLVRMSETRTSSSVFTLDSDFRRYRRHGRQVIPLITPGAAARR